MAKADNSIGEQHVEKVLSPHGFGRGSDSRVWSGARRRRADRCAGVQTDVAALSSLVEQQRRLLETQGRLIADLTKRLDETSKTVEASQQRISDLEAAGSGNPAADSTAPHRDRTVAADAAGAHRKGTRHRRLPGSFKIPGSDAGIRFGGQIRTVLVRNLGALGTDGSIRDVLHPH